MTQTNPIIRAAARAASSSKSTTAPGGDALKPAADAITTADSTAAATEPTSTANPVAANGQQSKKSATKLGRVTALLRRPLLLSGEEKADYDALAAVSNVVKPDDVVDDMLTTDAVYHQWNLLRLRRLSAGLINATKTEALRIVLTPLVADDNGFDEERLALRFTRGEHDATKTVDELLESAELTFDAVMGEAMELKIDEIERFDRMAIAAQACRDAALREIERRHLVLGQNLRRAFDEVEDADFQVIEPPAEREGAAGR